LWNKFHNQRETKVESFAYLNADRGAVDDHVRLDAQEKLSGVRRFFIRIRRGHVRHRVLRL